LEWSAARQQRRRENQHSKLFKHDGLTSSSVMQARINNSRFANAEFERTAVLKTIAFQAKKESNPVARSQRQASVAEERFTASDRGRATEIGKRARHLDPRR
jgi:hypothetical protein